MADVSRRRRLSARRQAIRNSHVLKLASPRYVAIFRYAARNASWATSSASLAEPSAA